MKTLSIIGFGGFGRFIAPYLSGLFDVHVTDVADISSSAEQIGVKEVTLAQAANCEVVLLAVPVQNMEAVLEEISPLLQPGTLVVDVASVKMKPVELMQKHLPDHVRILATHPLFGPQSGKNGLKGLRMVIYPVRDVEELKIKRLLEEAFGLDVLIRTPENHDREMAYVHALTHLVGRAVHEMAIPDLDQSTQAYDSLCLIRDNLGQDSWDLFVTIENHNPFASQMRTEFIEKITELDQRLENKE